MRIQQIFILALFMIAIISCKQEPEKLFAEQLFEAHLNVEKLPQASDAIERLSIEKAYEIHYKDFVKVVKKV